MSENDERQPDRASEIDTLASVAPALSSKFQEQTFTSREAVPGDYCPVQGKWYPVTIGTSQQEVRLTYTNLLEFRDQPTDDDIVRHMQQIWDYISADALGLGGGKLSGAAAREMVGDRVGDPYLQGMTRRWADKIRDVFYNKMTTKTQEHLLRKALPASRYTT